MCSRWSPCEHFQNRVSTKTKSTSHFGIEYQFSFVYVLCDIYSVLLFCLELPRDTIPLNFGSCSNEPQQLELPLLDPYNVLQTLFNDQSKSRELKQELTNTNRVLIEFTQVFSVLSSKWSWIQTILVSVCVSFPPLLLNFDKNKKQKKRE